MAFGAGVTVNCNNVFVSKLARATSSDRLREHFSRCGNVIYAEVKVDRGGCSRGCGVVEFDSAQAAWVALQSLNETELDGRLISVREDRDTPNPGKARSGCRLFVGDVADIRTSASHQPRRPGPAAAASHHYIPGRPCTHDMRGGAAGHLNVRACSSSRATQNMRHFA